MNESPLSDLEPPQPRGQRSLATTVLRNSMAITAGEWVVRLLNLVFSVYVVRVLGESGFGNYATVLAFAGFFGVFFELGIAQYAEREIARDPTRSRALFWNMVAIRLGLAVVGIGVMPLAAHALGYEWPLVQALVLHGTTFLLAALLAPLTNILEGNERFDLTVTFRIVNQVIWLAIAIPLVRLEPSFLVLVLSGVLALPPQILLSAIAVRKLRLNSFRLHLDVSQWPGIVRGGMPFALSSMTLGLGFTSDTLVLAQFYDQRVVGWYAAAYRLVFTVNSVASGFYRAVTPSLAREQTHSPQRVTAWVTTSLRLLLAGAIPAAGAISYLAPDVVRIVYGADFAPSALALRVIIWDVPCVVFNAFAGNVTTVLGLERRAARLYTISAIASVGLNVALIPIWGILAAATATVVTDVIKAAGLAYCLKGAISLRPMARPTLAAGAATAVMVGAMALARPWGVGAAIGAGALTYGTAALAFGVLDLPFVQSVASALRSLRPRRST